MLKIQLIKLQEAIVEQILKTNDVDLLDLIHKILITES